MASRPIPEYKSPSVSRPPYPRSHSSVASDERIARMLQADLDNELHLQRFRNCGRWNPPSSYLEPPHYIASSAPLAPKMQVSSCAQVPQHHSAPAVFVPASAPPPHTLATPSSAPRPKADNLCRPEPFAKPSQDPCHAVAHLDLWDSTVRGVGSKSKGSRLTVPENSDEQTDTEQANEAAALSVVMQELGLDCSPSFSKRSSRMRHRLAKTESIPHVMRVNSRAQPSHEEELTERERLSRNLRMYALKEVPMVADGNCQFRALADQLFGNEQKHAMVRRAVVLQLRMCWKRYAPYVPDSYNDYCKAMGRNKTWGDHITLQAAADKYKVKVTLVTSYKEKFIVEILPKGARPCADAWLSYYAEMHYNSVYPLDTQLQSSPQRKGNWLLDMF